MSVSAGHTINLVGMILDNNSNLSILYRSSMGDTHSLYARIVSLFTVDAVVFKHTIETLGLLDISHNPSDEPTIVSSTSLK